MKFIKISDVTYSVELLEKITTQLEPHSRWKDGRQEWSITFHFKKDNETATVRFIDEQIRDTVFYETNHFLGTTSPICYVIEPDLQKDEMLFDF